MNTLSPVEHKVSIVEKEIDTGFDVYTRHFAQLSTLRGWTLTLALAYLGFLLTVKSSDFLPVIPFGLILIFFMYLESGERINMRQTGLEVRLVEKIFMENDPAKFKKLVEEYEFRDLRLEKEQESWIKKKVNRIKQMFILGTIVWHLLLFLIAVITQWAIMSQMLR
jgi:hypothetical protein